MTSHQSVFSFDSDQLAAIKKMVDAAKPEGLGGVLNASELGSGKTAMTCEALHQIGVGTVLIIAPVNTLDAWADNMSAYTGLPTYIIDSTKTGKENHFKLKTGVTGAYLVGREFFALSATSLPPKLVSYDLNEEPVYTKGREALWSWSSCNRNLDAVVVDEGHSMSNRYAQGYKVLKQLAPRKIKMYLSATPFRSDFDRAWAPTRWLWPDIIDRSQARWRAEWAEFGYNPYAKSSFNKLKVVGEKTPGAFVQSLPCYVRVEYENKPVEMHKVRSSLTEPQQKQYEQMLENAFTWLDDNPLVAELPIVQLVRLRQMLLGEVAFNDKGEVDFASDCASDKIRQCVTIAQKHGDEKIIFFVDSRRFAKVLAERLTEAGQPSFAWVGGVSKAKRREAKTGFIGNDPNIKHIVAVPAAIGEGSDGLQWASHTEVWVNTPFDPVIVEQAKGRLNRRGQQADRVVRYQLIVPGTVDDDDLVRDMRKTRRMLESLS